MLREAHEYLFTLGSSGFSIVTDYQRVESTLLHDEQDRFLVLRHTIRDGSPNGLAC